MTARTLTQAELVTEARARFGDDQKRWAFVCPKCGDVAAAQDFIDAGADPSSVGQECIGRSVPGGRGCNYVAYGLFSGPWAIVVPNGSGTRTVSTFALADAPALAPGAPSEGSLRATALNPWTPLQSDAVHLLALLAQGNGIEASGAKLNMTYPMAKRRIFDALLAWGVPRTAALMHLACLRNVLPKDLPRPAPVRDLKLREREVLDGLALGDTYAEIGKSLCLSRETISTHVSRALKARGAKTAAQLVYLAHQDGLLSGEARNG